MLSSLGVSQALMDQQQLRVTELKSKLIMVFSKKTQSIVMAWVV
jgi:hypothetical protein